MIDWKISISAVFAGLLTVWIGHRFAASRSERQNYCNKVIEFKEVLIPFLKELESPDANPAVLVTQYFPEHDEAARKLMLHIPQKKQERFFRKWQLYEAFYEEKKSQGPMNIFATEVDDIGKASPSAPGSIEYIYQQTAKRRNEVRQLVRGALDAL